MAITEMGPMFGEPTHRVLAMDISKELMEWLLTRAKRDGLCVEDYVRKVLQREQVAEALE